MFEYRTKLSENGRIIIPALYRRQLHIEAGDEIIVRLEKDELRIFTIKHALEKAQKLVRKHAKNKNLIQLLKKMRQEDVNNE